MRATPYRIAYYAKKNGRKPFREWFLSLRDNVAMQKIAARLDRVELGNLGDHKGIGDGIMELRVNYGPGYRVYYAFDNEVIVLLLLGGDKSTQCKDIERAREYWSDYKERKQCVP